MATSIIDFYRIQVRLDSSDQISFGFSTIDELNSNIGNISSLYKHPKYHKEIIDDLIKLIYSSEPGNDIGITNENFFEIHNSDLSYNWGMYEHCMFSYKNLTLYDFFGKFTILNTKEILACLIDFWNFLIVWEDEVLLTEKLKPAFDFFQKNYNPKKLFHFNSNDENYKNIEFRIIFDEDGQNINYDQFIKKIEWPLFTKREFIYKMS